MIVWKCCLLFKRRYNKTNIVLITLVEIKKLVVWLQRGTESQNKIEKHKAGWYLSIDITGLNIKQLLLKSTRSRTKLDEFRTLLS